MMNFNGLADTDEKTVKVALRSGDTIASEVTTEAWLLLIEN